MDRWIQVVGGIDDGSLTIGTRTPVAGTPAWATLEVRYGGFASGNLLEGGILQPHEQAWIQQLHFGKEKGQGDGEGRSELNEFFLMQGMAQLRTWLDTGKYRIEVPEEGALLVVAWLVEQNRLDEAKQILSELRPFLDKLRFYPTPAEQSILLEPTVSLQTVGETIAELKHISVPLTIQAEREGILVWLPIYDQMIALFIETVEGMAPYVPLEEEEGMDGSRRPLRREDGQYQTAGGWPCQYYPADWTERGKALVGHYEEQRSTYTSSKKFHTGRNFVTLLDCLKRCVIDPTLLSGYEVGCIRSTLAEFAFRRGPPGSERHRQLRQHQQERTKQPTRRDLADLLISRLLPFPAERGLEEIDTVSRPVGMEEEEEFGVPTGTNLPASLLQRLQRCREATVTYLVQNKIIPSSEAIAKVLPSLTAQLQATALEDIRLRWLYSALYTSFRRRRSLLLWNLQHQVRFDELPWARVLQAERSAASHRIQQAGIELLSEVISSTITTFPQQILPNRLLQELRSLAETAGLQLPMVDELATDIFMGEFSEKFLRAAQQAALLLAGGLYERYYNLDYERILAIDDVGRSPYGTPTSAEFARYCRELAGAASPSQWGPAFNGMIIEQQQILTTHNLAPLFIELGLAERLNPTKLEEMGKSCFIWICLTLQRISHWKDTLRNLKNSAYAWRQMVFYLSVLPTASQQASWLSWAQSYLTEQTQPFQQRFRPVLDDLIQVATSSTTSQILQKRQPFLGWSVGKHRLMPEVFS